MMMMKFQNDFLNLISFVYFRFEKKQNKTKKTDTQASENITAKFQQRRTRENGRWRWKHGHGVLHPN